MANNTMANNTMANNTMADGLADILLERHGVYAGNWTEKSVRLAGGGDMGRRGSRTAVYGHWLLPDGRLTGQLRDHAESALAALQTAATDYQPQAGPISDLMAQAGVIRVRHSPPAMCIIDIVRPRTTRQLEKLGELARSVEGAGGTFLWTAMNERDTATVGEGVSYADLCEFHWPCRRDSEGADRT